MLDLNNYIGLRCARMC